MAKFHLHIELLCRLNIQHLCSCTLPFLHADVCIQLCANVSPHLIVQVTELFHQVLGDPLPDIGLVVSHTVLGVQADASHTPLPICGVFKQPVVLRQVVYWVPIGTMDPGSAKLQSCFSCSTEKSIEINLKNTGSPKCP